MVRALARGMTGFLVSAFLVLGPADVSAEPRLTDVSLRSPLESSVLRPLGAARDEGGGDAVGSWGVAGGCAGAFTGYFVAGLVGGLVATLLPMEVSLDGAIVVAMVTGLAGGVAGGYWGYEAGADADGGAQVPRYGISAACAGGAVVLLVGAALSFLVSGA